MNIDAKPIEMQTQHNLRQSGEQVIWQRFAVTYDFPIHFLRDAFAPEAHVLRDVLTLREPDKQHRCLVFLDDGLARAQPDLVPRLNAHFAAHADCMTSVTEVQLVPGGEVAKKDNVALTRISQTIADTGIDRHSFVIAIGGGAVLDTVGYAAATAHRGIRHIRFPTTVLSQNDSGVGVKNAVNAYGQKNYSGTFAPPWAVINDLDLLTALPAKERRAGLSEAVKVALIRDGAFFGWMEANAARLRNFDLAAEEQMIRRCAQLHIDQIGRGGDPFESGSSRPLDFGHWAAHRLEAMTGLQLGHGHAVAIGIALDARYSVLVGKLPQGCEDRIVALLRALDLPIWHPMLDARDASGGLEVLAGLDHFRAHLGGELTITLLSAIGTGYDVHEMEYDRVEQAISWLKGLAE
ncbi:MULTISPECIES: 3-dehydroquinate synthase [unclassified Marinovum]